MRGDDVGNNSSTKDGQGKADDIPGDSGGSSGESGGVAVGAAASMMHRENKGKEPLLQNKADKGGSDDISQNETSQEVNSKHREREAAPQAVPIPLTAMESQQ
eukprot:12218931-Ditylum_brightwellii.AAC.1